MKLQQPQQQRLSLPKLTGDSSTWKGSHVLSVAQLSLAGIQLLFRHSHAMRRLVRSNGGDSRLRHRQLAGIFFEASTRTANSFQSAIQRLGGNFIQVDCSAESNTSAGKKGESLEDTVRCLECYADAMVVRHPAQGSLERVATAATKPVINAGDGVGEHPTQALLDAYTIYDELHLHQQPKQHLTVVLLGDLKHGRTVHSLSKLLASSRGLLWTDKMTLRYCSPALLQMPGSIQDSISLSSAASDNAIEQETYTDLQEACEGSTDILYVTRIQRERFTCEQEYETVKGSYVINPDFMQATRASNSLVMHPLPRVDEISVLVDPDPRAAYFRQMENGMFVRMALLDLVLGNSNRTIERSDAIND